MRITFTADAVRKLESGSPGTGKLKLLYDTEGCGCVMSGVPALQWIADPVQGDVKAESIPFEVWYEPRYEVFFEDSIKVDYSDSSHAFVLKSDNQTYTNHMRVVSAV
ncbi:iron-sulfur cluster biosynthesis family protein [Paenibacillus sambharensis]|uniref:Iron-sulfur cluster biosynthesis family protein n=1 Tax=Paenibacillus sambharensis TaxID=1803190 RepID=A0A2W1L125_9BACL|nr:iron-sulfur cluster biosynthesis family protein [Paenibacillus sambharensis]PZD93628.1 iron-sulfur cluster biosynthesis family protein [Paenibacillus sambharensis]